MLKNLFICFSVAALIFGLTGCSKEEPKPNNNPVISSLTANPTAIEANSIAEIACTASDQDGDTLTYSWSVAEGKIEGDGKTVKFIAPEKGGDYAVNVEVNDGRGGIAKETVKISVNSKPVIESLTAKETEVKIKGKTEIACVAKDADNDSLTYNWSATAGEIAADATGANAVFTAPAEPADTCTITVKVSDGKGEETKTIDLKVVKKAGKSAKKSK